MTVVDAACTTVATVIDCCGFGTASGAAVGSFGGVGVLMSVGIISS
jgi:hypothetical protein